MQRSHVLHYRLEGKLGAGGMGVVYRALDTRLQRTVALKFLPEALTTDGEARARLLSEARAAAQLDHPNIGTVYAVEEAEDAQLFIAMAHYEGKTLENYLIPLPTAEALALGADIARGLGHAHGAGVVHHDVKPGNVLVTPAGDVKILDFGLSKLKEPGGVTQAGATLGTMEYMSPEQVRGQPADHRSDLWALGVMLYELLTGVSPFRATMGAGGDAAATILRVLSVRPGPPSALQPELPTGVDEVLAKALAKDLRARYGTAQELFKDLEALRRGALVRAAPQSSATVSPTVSPTMPPAAVPTLEAPLKATSLPRHNLAGATTPLVGRQGELALLALYLSDPDCRVVTLLGLGGTGKTRLGVQAAREQVRADTLFTDGVYFVALEALSTPALILTSIAEATSLPLQGEREPLGQIVRAIGKHHLLLVLDNFEHLLEGATLLSDLVRGCPNLKLLVTSRARLDLLEEWTLPLQGLPYPDRNPSSEPSDSAYTGSELLDSEPLGSASLARAYSESEAAAARGCGAVALFAERAKRVQPSFSLDAGTLPHVVTICRLVRGLPLGLELAAAWVRLMSCAEIAREIEQNLDFLTTSARNVTERHRSLRAVFEHSYVLLTPDEQRVLGKLSVFQGGFSRDAAQQVALAPLATLADLIDRSLVSSAQEARYEWHPLLHQYAREKLAEDPGEQRRVDAAHGAYYLHFLQQQGKGVRGADQREVLGAVERELENIRTAWRWAVKETQTEAIKRTAEPLRIFFDQRGRIHEGIELFSPLTFDQGGAALPPDAWGYVLVNHAYLHLRLGDHEKVKQLAQNGIDLLVAANETRGVILGLTRSGCSRTKCRTLPPG